MSDPDALLGRPAYWDQCEAMGFGPLAAFIGSAANKLSSSSALVEGGQPCSREELLALCDLLSRKAAEFKEYGPLPEPPVYEGPEFPGPFVPSYDLLSLHKKRERHERHVDEAIDRGDSDVYIEYVEDQLKKVVELEVDPLERKERQKHERILEEFRAVYRPYQESYARWQGEAARRQTDEEKREATVQRLYKKVRGAPRAARGGILPFELAAPGEGDDEHIRGYFRGVLSRRRLNGFSQDRLDKVLALPRSNWKRGTAGKDGYIVVIFDHTEKVLLECPLYGKALFVLSSGEDRLLTMNKQELRDSDEVRRIFHTKGWYRRVKEALEIEEAPSE